MITDDYRYPFRPTFNFLPYYTCINTSHEFFFNFFSRLQVITCNYRLPFRLPFKLSTLYMYTNTSQPLYFLQKVKYQKSDHRRPYWLTSYPIYMYMHSSLVPRQLPVFQCCTLKNGRAWYLIACDSHTCILLVSSVLSDTIYIHISVNDNC